MRKFRFLDWQVYKDAKLLCILVQNIVTRLPREQRFEIGSQLMRASQSVVLNIAEGSGKTSDKELNRFFDIALGSLYETLASLDLLRDAGVIAPADFTALQGRVASICDQLGGFKKRIKG